MKKIILFSLILISYINLYSQENLKFSFQIRPRFEIDNKDFKSSTNPNTFTQLRTRLGLSFNPLRNLSGFIQIQDSRTFGEEQSTLTNTKNLDVHQAYFIIKDIFNLPLDIKIGRMELSYGSEKFIGPVGWSNIGRAFDGGVITYTNKSIKAEIFAIREIEKFNPSDSLDQNIYGLFTDLYLKSSIKIQPFIIWQRINPTSYLDRATIGFYSKGEHGRFTHEIDFGYQFGSAFIANRKQNINAYTFSLSGDYTFKLKHKPTIGLQLDYASGDNNPADNNYKTYTTLYPTSHKFYGYMDYFINLQNDTYGLGIIDLIAKLSCTHLDKIKFNFNYHLFKSAEDYKYVFGSTSNNFGSELDLVINYKYNEYTNFEGGASLFLPGDIFKEKKGKNNSTWFYIMAIINI
ncbi:alginate export family protein [Rosettibacter firmus]|uniref:alginate export family protein n=1 Tax=Rosettibacter firmus TaxID=3111522 RepID=UPI00336BCEBF